MKIYIGSDHNGFHLKEKVFAHLVKLNHDVQDVGDKVLDPNDDYPQFAFAATTKVLGDEDPDARAILICGSGQGMCMAANRVHGIRAALAWDERVAKSSRNDENSNILCLPGSMVDEETIIKIVDTWINTPFSNAPRHKRRIKEIEDIYG